MKKRLRKKLGKGEFTEKGFCISVYSDLKDHEKIIDQMDLFIDLIESYKMICGGGGDDKKFGFYVLKHRKPITEEERLEVIEKAKLIPNVTHIIASPLSTGSESQKYIDAYFDNHTRMEKEYEQ